MSFLLSVVRLDSGDDSFGAVRLADRAHRHARRQVYRVAVLDCLFRAGFSAGAGVDICCSIRTLAFSTPSRKSLPFVDGALFNPYSFWGIVWVHTSTGGIWFKVMLLVPVFRRLGATLEEAARVAGANTATMLWRITLPVLGADDSGGLGAELHSRPAIVQHRTVARHAGGHLRLLDEDLRSTCTASRAPMAKPRRWDRYFCSCSQCCCFSIGSFCSGNKKFTVVTGQGYSTLRVKLGKWRYVAFAGCLLYVVVMMLLPLTFLVIGSFMRRYGFFNIAAPFTCQSLAQPARPIRSFLVALKNSLIIASVTAIGGILLYSVARLFAGVAADEVRSAARKPLLDSPCAAGDLAEPGRALAVSRHAVALFSLRHGVGYRLAL